MSVLNEPQPTTVSETRLRLAMELGGFASYASLNVASGISSDTLRGWGKGRVERPSPQSRDAVEEHLPVTFDFLTDPTPLPEISHVHFRSLKSTEDRARTGMRAYLSVLAWVTQNILGKLPRDVSSIHETVGGADRTAGAVAAGKLRRKLGLGPLPIADVIGLVEGLGVVVAYGPRQTAKIDACSGRAGRHALIALNPSKGDYYRQRWDVAHELGHLVMHEGTDRPENNRTREAQADGFAEALLYPASNRAIRELRDEVSIAATDEDESFARLLQMQDEWGISFDALLQLARQTVRGERAKSALEALSMKRLRTGPKTAPVGRARVPEQPRLLPDAINEAVAAGQMRVETLAFDLGLKPKVLRTMAAKTPSEVAW